MRVLTFDVPPQEVNFVLFIIIAKSRHFMSKTLKSITFVTEHFSILYILYCINYVIVKIVKHGKNVRTNFAVLQFVTSIKKF